MATTNLYPQLHNRRSTAAFVLGGFYYRFHMRVFLQVLSQRLP